MSLALGPVEELKKAVSEAAISLRGDGDSPAATLERPPRAEFGDYSSNVAMLLAPALRGQPREIAERVGGALEGTMGGALERFEVAGPGFLNIFLSDSWFRGALAAIRAHGEGFGGGFVPAAER